MSRYLRYALAPAFTALLVAQGCARGETLTFSEVDQKIADAKRLLSEGRFRPAQAEFWEIVNPQSGLAPDHCEAQYGYMLASLFEVVGGLANAGDWSGRKNGNRIGMGDLSPLAATNVTDELDGYIVSFLDPVIEGYLLPAEEWLPKIIASGCEFRIDAGIPFETAETTGIRVGKVFGPVEAKFALAVGTGLHGALNWLTAHDLRIDLQTALAAVDEVLDTEDSTLLARAIAGAVDASPEFLAFHPERETRLVDAAPQLVAGITLFREVIRELFVDAGEKGRDRVLAYIDANRNGSIDHGDELWLGVTGAEPELDIFGQHIRNYPIDLASGDAGHLIGAWLFSIVDEEFIAKLDRLLDRVSDNISGTGQMFNPAEANALLPINLIPDAFALDLSRLFPADLADAKPLRRVLPAWGRYDPPGGEGTFLGHYVAFLVEAEIAADRPLADYAQEVTANDPALFCYACAPGARFSQALYGAASTYFTMAAEPAEVMGTVEVAGLPDDCEDPQGDDTYGYAWYQDPTVNGVLFINVAGLNRPYCVNDAGSTGARWGNRPVPRSSAIPANRYSLNKAIVVLLGGLPDLADAF